MRNLKGRLKRMEHDTQHLQIPLVDVEVLLLGKAIYEGHRDGLPCSLSPVEQLDAIGAAIGEGWKFSGDEIPGNRGITLPKQAMCSFHDCLCTVLRAAHFQRILSHLEAGGVVSEAMAQPYRLYDEDTPEEVIRRHAKWLAFCEDQAIRAYGERRHTMCSAEYLLARTVANAWWQEEGGEA